MQAPVTCGVITPRVPSAVITARVPSATIVARVTSATIVARVPSASACYKCSYNCTSSASICTSSILQTIGRTFSSNSLTSKLRPLFK